MKNPPDSPGGPPSVTESKNSSVIGTNANPRPNGTTAPPIAWSSNDSAEITAHSR